MTFEVTPTQPHNKAFLGFQKRRIVAAEFKSRQFVSTTNTFMVPIGVCCRILASGDKVLCLTERVYQVKANGNCKIILEIKVGSSSLHS